MSDGGRGNTDGNSVNPIISDKDKWSPSEAWLKDRPPKFWEDTPYSLSGGCSAEVIKKLDSRIVKLEGQVSLLKKTLLEKVGDDD